MSMIACNECATLINADAVKCPRCGYNTPWSTGFIIGFWLTIAFFITMFLIAGSTGGGHAS